ncbi:MAG: DUF952 domain-containing protein, partial [Alkalispirochaeta sp.]
MNDRPRIYHISDETSLRGADTPDGDRFYRPESLETEGFIHCSYRGQVGSTLHRYFLDEAGSLPEGLIVAEIDPFLTDAVIRAVDAKPERVVFI